MPTPLWIAGCYGCDRFPGWAFFNGNSQYLAFVRVEFQFVFAFQGLEYMEVSLQYGRVLRCEDLSVEEAVISEKSDVCTWGELLIYVINVGQEQKGAEAYTLSSSPPTA